MCLHERESSGDMNTYLGNGQALDKVTTIEPGGRGPFDSFEDGAVDALVHEGFHKIKDWSIARCLFCAEVFNGPGYRSHGVPSPYVWAGTDQYRTGKYDRDGHFVANLTDPQLGVAIMLQALISLGMLAVNTVTNPNNSTGITVTKPNNSTGITVSHTTTSTNFISVIVGAALTVLGTQSFGADAIHTLAALGGPIAVVAGILNQLHITGGANANTLDHIVALTQQIADMAAAKESATIAMGKPQSIDPVAEIVKVAQQ
jgi:hypothetical protein